MPEKFFFLVFGVLAVAGALLTVTRTNIVHGLLFLVFTFLNVAGIYLLTQAYFLAVIQVLVYAGAILVLFAFVVMFLNLREFQQQEQVHRSQRWVVLVIAPLLLAEFVAVVVTTTWESVSGGLDPEAAAAAGGNVRVLGVSLFNDMLLPFEVASLILLVGMVGAVVLARKELGTSVGLREWSDAEEPSPALVEQEV